MPILGYFGIGSNISNREKNLFKALDYLSRKYKILEVSSLYNTEPVGYINQDDFLNMVIKVDTKGEDPFKILSFVKSVEKIMGRKDTLRWGPRIIDIDILYIDGVYIRSETLNIPHISILKRDFVLVPLYEIENELIDPKSQNKIENLIKLLDEKYIMF